MPALAKRSREIGIHIQSTAIRNRATRIYIRATAADSREIAANIQEIAANIQEMAVNSEEIGIYRPRNAAAAWDGYRQPCFRRQQSINQCVTHLLYKNSGRPAGRNRRIWWGDPVRPCV